MAQNEFSIFLKSEEGERSAQLETLIGSTIYSTLSQRAYARATHERLEKERIEARFADQKLLSDDTLAQLTQDSLTTQEAVASADAQKMTLGAQLRWFADDKRWHTSIEQALQAELQQQANQDAASSRADHLNQVDAVQDARPMAMEVQRLNTALAQADRGCCC